MKSIAVTITLCSLLLHTAARSQQTRNIISVSPVQITNASPTGFGFQYERMLTKKLSLYVPLAYAFGQYDPCEPGSSIQMGYAFPGIKFYPAGNTHKISYSVGPSLAIGVGRLTYSDLTLCPVGEGNFNFNQHPMETQFGMLVNNTLNLNISRHLYAGLEAGMGIMYFDKIDGRNYGSNIMIQGNLRFGYRF